VDLVATEAVIEHFIETGVDGISPLGSTGEASHLTSEERKRFIEEVTRIVGGRVPLVVGVGAAGTREAVELARHAEGVGVHAVLIVSPFYCAHRPPFLLEGEGGRAVQALRDRRGVGRYSGPGI